MAGFETYVSRSVFVISVSWNSKKAKLKKNMKFILGRKLNMTQHFLENGEMLPLTAILAGPCVVTQIRTTEKDGYSAVQVGFGKKNHVNKPMEGHLKAAGKVAVLREFRLNADSEEYKVGDKIEVDVFEAGDKAKIIGHSKGRGFAGVVKRHGFHGQDKGHGNKDQLRMPGSIGATDADRVFKGTRMGGRMGMEQVTVKNVKIFEVDKAKNLVYVIGPVPGARNSLVEIRVEK